MNHRLRSLEFSVAKNLLLPTRKLTWLAGKSTIWRCTSYWKMVIVPASHVMLLFSGPGLWWKNSSPSPSLDFPKRFPIQLTKSITTIWGPKKKGGRVPRPRLDQAFHAAHSLQRLVYRHPHRSPDERRSRLIPFPQVWHRTYWDGTYSKSGDDVHAST